MRELEIERATAEISRDDLAELLAGSIDCLERYFLWGKGRKWQALYDLEQPLAVALCQGAAMHYLDKVNGVKDFDVWFFFPFSGEHLPYRTIWNWDYVNPKFGRHPDVWGYAGRRVDVIVRSIHHFVEADPVQTILRYLQEENTVSSRELAKKAVVMLGPGELLGRGVWYKQKMATGLIPGRREFKR